MKIRDLNIQNVHLKGETDMPFVEIDKNNFKLGIEILMKIPENYPDVLKQAWGECIYNPVEYSKKALLKKNDFLAVKFNLDENDLDELDKYLQMLSEIETISQKPLIVTGSELEEVDEVLLPKITETLQKPAIIGSFCEKNYKKTLKNFDNHKIIARTPIDINLAKELNILLSDFGVSLDNILIDTTIGALGYGLDYAYSVIERIKQAALGGDEYLNMPIISFVGEEVFKSKETKSSEYAPSWGKIEERATMWEVATAGAFMAAGSNILVVRHPKTLSTLNKLIAKG